MSTTEFVQTLSAIQDPAREGELYEQLTQLRRRVEPIIEGGSALPEAERHGSIARALTAIGAIMELVGSRANLTGGDAGHGPGHWARDFMHSLRLAHDPLMPTSAILPGVVAGTLHDLGTVLVDRYADSTRAVRHAECGALVVRAAALETNVLEPVEADVVAYAIAGHTHYLAESKVMCADGTERIVRPFMDMCGDKPFMPMWYPRWVDRLDCNGPCFIGRHYLTLHRDHYDFGKSHDEANGAFYKVSFADHMRPILRSADEIRVAGGKRTFVEHATMFARSQSAESPYGKRDFGDMVTLRDDYRARLELILNAVLKPDPIDIRRTVSYWTTFLSSNIEPSDLGRKAAAELEEGFFKLPNDEQRAWACGFHATLRMYLSWSQDRLEFLNAQPKSHLCLPGIVDDVRDWIRPDPSWASALSA